MIIPALSIRAAADPAVRDLWGKSAEQPLINVAALGKRAASGLLRDTDPRQALVRQNGTRRYIW
jgi:hypothetical protein